MMTKNINASLTYKDLVSFIDVNILLVVDEKISYVQVEDEKKSFKNI